MYIYGLTNIIMGAEMYDPKVEAPKDNNAGAISRNALDEELAMSTSKEKADEVKDMLTAESKDVQNVEVDSDKLQEIKFSYKGYEIQYETGGMDLVSIKDAKGDIHVFDFTNSVLPEKVDNTNKAHTKALLGRTDFCINLQGLISTRLEKGGLKLYSDPDDIPIYVRGPKLNENMAYLATEKTLQQGEKGYKEGKEKKEFAYYQFAIAAKKDKDPLTPLKDKADFKEKTA